jgi:ATP-dependent Zn protease
MDSTFISLLISWFPLIVLIAIWILFMRRTRSTQAVTIDYMKKQVELTERMATALERIAATVEKRND